MSSASTSGYTAALTRQFSGRIDELELDDLGKHFLRDRWLDQLLWFEANAGNNKRRSHGRGDPAARVGDVPRQPRRRAQRLARGLLPLRRAVALVPPHPEMLKAQG